MNRPDKPGELSIDEILASIRQKTSEPPEATPSASDTPDDTASVTRSGTVSPPPPPPPQAPTALLDRLNGVLKNGAQAGGPNGSKRPLSFDQDLADMLDEPGTADGASAAPKPEMRVTPELRPRGGTSSPASDSPVAAAPPASPSSSAALTPSAPLVPPPPFGRADDGAPARAEAFGFPPLTKRAGFYPPQRAEPVLPPVRAESGATPKTEAAPTSSASDAAAAPPVSGAGSPSGFPDFGSLVPGELAGRGVPPPSSFGAPPRAAALSPDEGPTGVGRTLPELGAAARPAVAEPGASLATPAAGVIPSLSTPPEPAPTAPAPAKLDEPARVTPAKARESASSPTLASGSGASVAAEVDTDAATQALDALAQGLAAASAKTETPAVALKPVAGGAAGPVESSAPPAASAPGPAAPVRTLEDAVADMLRPMLQQWVQENMPRIMEKALRVEMAKTLGSSGTKPPGS